MGGRGGDDFALSFGESAAKNFNKGLLKSKTAVRRRFAVSKTRLSPSALLFLRIVRYKNEEFVALWIILLIMK